MREQQGVRTGPARTAPGTPYLTSGPTAGERPRLFCFHHSGGSAAAFAALRTALAPRVDVVAVQLPGRERRLRHPMPGSMADLVTELDEHLDPYLTGPYACYGHSMGALVAHDLVARRQARGAPLPVRLIAGACRAPQLSAAFAAEHSRSDDHLVRRMLEIGGLSPELLRYPDWLRSAVSLNRGDLRLCASRDTAATEPLRCAIDVFHGIEDPLVQERDALAWNERSTVGCRLHRFPGGHFFFLRESRAAFTDRLAALLTGAPDLVGGA
nr:alpha/beta fold hydrolase [Streptomyces sp. NBC_00857]